MTGLFAPRPVVVGGRTALLGPSGLEPAHFYVCPDPSPERVRRFAAEGVRGVSFSATADFHPYGLARPVLAADGTRDFGEFDARCRKILSASPSALLLPRVHVCSPPWWDAAHPGELVRFEDGGAFIAKEEGYLKKVAASFSSRVWRDFAADNLRALVAHALASDYAHAIVGMVVCGGRTEEWFHLGSVQDVLCDGGETGRAAFTAALEAAPTETLARVLRAAGVVRPADAMPSFARRRSVVGPERLLDPVRHADVLFFEDVFAAETADVVAELCRTVDTASGGRFAAGAFYGYLVEMACHGAAMRHGGHLALDRLLNEPAVAFLSSPTSYVRRNPATGASFSMLPTETVLARGKAFFHENDVRTCLLWEDAGYGRADTVEESVVQLRREVDFAVRHGLGLWWFDMVGGFYDHPSFEAEAGRGVRAAKSEIASGAPRSQSRIAFMVDEDSLRTTDLWGDWYSDHLPRQLAEVARLGEEFGVYTTADFFGRVLPSGATFDLVLWPNLFRVEARTLERLRDLDASGCVKMQVFLGPCGMAPLTAGPGSKPSAVVGMEIAVIPGSHALRLIPDPVLFPGVPEFGRGHWWPWRLTPSAGTSATGAGVVVLARDHEGRPAAVLRADRAFVAGPILPLEILRRILDRISD